MRKKIIKGVCLLLILLNLTGCVKFNVNMAINKDKSMDFSIIYALDTQYFGEQEIFEEEDINNVKNNGFTVDDYINGTMKGVKLTKIVKNIDLVSTSNNYGEFDLSAITESKQDSYLFKIDKGFFKNKYTAKIKFDSSNNNLSPEEDNENEDNNIVDNEDTNGDNNIDNNGDAINYNIKNNGMSLLENDTTDTNTDDNTDSDADVNNENNDEVDDSVNEENGDSELPEISTNMDMSFNVTLPYSALSHNATNTNNDNKELTWTLSQDKTDYIEFQFELKNMTNIYIVSGIAGVIVILSVVGVVLFIKKKKNNNNIDNNTAVNQDNIQNINTENSFNGQVNPNGYEKPTVIDVNNQSINNSVDENVNSNVGIPKNEAVNSQTVHNLSTNNLGNVSQKVEPLNNPAINEQVNNFGNVQSTVVGVTSGSINNSVDTNNTVSMTTNNVINNQPVNDLPTNHLNNGNQNGNLTGNSNNLNTIPVNNNLNIAPSTNVVNSINNNQNSQVQEKNINKTFDNNNNNFVNKSNSSVNTPTDNANSVIGNYIHIPGQSNSNNNSETVMPNNNLNATTNGQPTVQVPTPVNIDQNFSNIVNSQNGNINGN